MKTFAAILGILGFFIIAGTAGASDFYYECLAAADCVAGEPMSGLREAVQIAIGLFLLVVGFIGTMAAQD